MALAGAANAVEDISAVSNARRDTSAVEIFTKFIKKAEEAAQSSL